MIIRSFFWVVVLLCATTANALDINGIALGVRTSPEDLKTKLGVECAGLDYEHFSCEGNTTIEGVRVAVIVEGLYSIPTSIVMHFHPMYYQTIGAAAIGKWGKPTSSATKAMQNGFGARRDIFVNVWEEKKTGAQATLANVSAQLGMDECELKLETLEEIQMHAPKKGSSL